MSQEHILREHIKFVRKAREDHGEVDFQVLAEKELNKARTLLGQGNEHFYDIRESFEDLGKRNLVDRIVAESGLELPIRTDNQLVMVVSDKRASLMPYFEESTRRKVRHFSTFPNVKETGMPFVILTDSDTDHAQIQKLFPSSTVMYLAKNEREAERLRGEDRYVVNLGQVGGARHTDGKWAIGEAIVSAYFHTIAAERSKGNTGMLSIVDAISAGIQKTRDKMLYATRLSDFYEIARDYYKDQQRFRGMPLALQVADEVLMKACPRGGCVAITEPDRGGCCGGGNLPGVIIDFAIDYRKTVGDHAFIDGLKAYHGGKIKKPWYLESRQYTRVFKGLEMRKEDDVMTF